jgi:dolichyl-phosphate beta-glucosyltransferase
MLNDGMSKKTLFKSYYCYHLRAFDVEVLYIAEKYNIPIVEVDVNWQEIPGSKLDPFTASIQMGIDILAIWLRYMLGIWKIQPKNE